MSACFSQTKAPADHLDYEISYERWLNAGDTVQSATAAHTGSETLVITAVQVMQQTVTVWVQGGADGDIARITVDAVTAQGRTKQVCFDLRIRDC